MPDQAEEHRIREAAFRIAFEIEAHEGHPVEIESLIRSAEKILQFLRWPKGIE